MAEHIETSSAKFGKPILISLLVIIVILLLGGAYYLGGKNNLKTPVYPSSAPAGSNTPTISQPVGSTPTVSPSPVSPFKKISAGSSIGVFHPYSIEVPESWNSNESKNDYLDELTITKGGYKLSVKQAGGEGEKCVYDKNQQEMFSAFYAYYIDFGGDHHFRRSGDSQDSQRFIICEPKQEGFGAPTFYGYVEYFVPANPDQGTLSEMDSIVATLSNNP